MVSKRVTTQPYDLIVIVKISSKNFFVKKISFNLDWENANYERKRQTLLFQIVTCLTIETIAVFKLQTCLEVVILKKKPNSIQLCRSGTVINF